MDLKNIANTHSRLPYYTQPRLLIYTDPVLLQAAYELKGRLLVSKVTRVEGYNMVETCKKETCTSSETTRPSSKMGSRRL